MPMRTYLLVTLALLALALPGVANGQLDPSIDVEQLPCLEIEANRAVRATVRNDVPGSQVRLYFRRLHELVEDFYWIDMNAEGAGSYWSVFPKPADEELDEKKLEKDRQELLAFKEKLRSQGKSDEIDEYQKALWWRVKELSSDRNPNGDLDQEKIEIRAAEGRLETRHWMELLDDAAFNEWLGELKNEPAEYYAAVFDAYGRRVAMTDVKVVEVRKKCDTELNQAELGRANNLIVGETSEWQISEDVFHWLCDGVISRVDFNGIWRADDRCRACVIAWWKKKSFLVPAAGGLTTTGVVLIGRDDPKPASPTRP